MEKSLIFLASLLPITVVLFGPISSDWFMNSYGPLGGFVLLPAILVVAAFVQAGIYYRYIFPSLDVLFRASASLLLGICGVVLAVSFWFAWGSVFPHPHHGM